MTGQPIDATAHDEVRAEIVGQAEQFVTIRRCRSRGHRRGRSGPVRQT